MTFKTLPRTLAPTIEAAVTRLVAEAPPLDDATIAKLRVLLSSGGAL